MDALWQRLEDAATAHQEEVQQSQQQLQDASRTHEQAEQELRQMAADASCAHEQEVRELLQRLEDACVTHRQQLGNLQQQHEKEAAVEGKRHKAALSQVRFQGRRGGGVCCTHQAPRRQVNTGLYCTSSACSLTSKLCYGVWLWTDLACRHAHLSVASRLWGQL